MSEGGSDDKEHEPTARKLEEARRKGEVPKSNDLATAAAYAGLLLVGLGLGGPTLRHVGEVGMVLLGQADRFAQAFSESGTAPAGGLMLRLTLGLWPWFLMPALAVVAMLMAQRALVFAPEKLIPKKSRISLISNARNKFGRNGLFEFSKSLAKLIVISVLLWLFLLGRLPRIVSTLYLGPQMTAVEMMRLVAEFMALVVVIMGVVGTLDFFWQRFEHLRKNRMSQKEVRDEMKHSEGDPHMKQQRRQRGYEIATNRMLLDVPEADVLIVNPTHFAVALKWDRLSRSAPVCVAKGVDELAARIREKAAEAGVPIRSDPPTARAIYASVEIGAEIRSEHYRAVAAAIRFSEAMRMRAADRSGWRRT